MSQNKRIALLRDGVVFNITVGLDVNEIASLFDCQAIEVTESTLPANIGERFIDGQFTQPVIEAVDPFADENGFVAPPLNPSEPQI